MRAAEFRVAVAPVAPQADLDLDVRTMRSWLAVDDDGDPVLVVKDDDVTVVVDFGLGGAWDTAIRAAERLSDTALAYASRLREVMAAQQTSPVEQQPAENKEEPCQVSKDGVTVDLTAASWVKSSRSGPYSDNCVEVTGLDGPLVAVRDSKDATGPALAFTREEWTAFVEGAGDGEFNLVG